MWPTPMKSDADRGSGTYMRGNPTLTGMARMFPTPTVKGNHNRAGLSKNSGDGLATFVGRFPTPTAQDAANNGGPSQSSRNTPPLNSVVGGKLNPKFVEWLMGFPVGWTDLEDSETP